MKKLSLLLSLSLSLSLVKADYWTQKASLPADDRAAAAGFSISGKGYIGTGIKFGGPVQFHNDFWEYDPVTNAWLQKTDFGGTSRSGGAGFSLLDKGYIACGYDANIVQQDVWQYNKILNSWTQKASLPAPGRDYTVALTIDSFAYIGTGYNSTGTNYQDFWQYNPITDSWSQKADVGGPVRSSAIAFSANGKGFIGGGYSATFIDDFWEYDPAINAWTQKANIPPGGRSDACAFAINGYGYVLTGQFSLSTANDLWKYDHTTNTWLQKTSLPGPARTNAVAFSIGNKGYIGTGWDATFNSLNDFWEYTSDSTTGVEEIPIPIAIGTKIQFSISPNPAKELLVIRYTLLVNEKIDLKITDVHGKIILQAQPSIINHQSSISLKGFSKGIYFVEVNKACLPDRQGKEKAVKRFVKE